MKLTDIALDEALIEQGRRDEYPLDSEIVVWTKRAYTPEWSAAYHGVLADCVADPETGKYSAKDQARAILVATCSTCFVRWEGVQGSIVNGKYEPTDDALEYTTEVGLALFDPEKTRRWEHFFGWWSLIAETQKRYRSHQVAISGKKPGTSSDGTLRTDNTNDST